MTLCPHYILKSPKIKYYMCSNTDVRDFKKYNDLITNYSDEHRNEKFLSLAFRLSNTGKLQLEDYRVEIDCRNGVKTFFAPLDFSFLSSWGEKKPQDLIINSNGNPNAKYAPEDGSPLNQKDHRDFEFYMCPDPEADKAVLVWKIIAKDFYKEGKFVIRLKPKITEFDDIQIVPMPSCHAKGCLAMICGDYAFLGDGVFCKYKGEHHLYNQQVLKTMIEFLEALPCKYVALDHEENFIQHRRSVILIYKDIYSRRKPDEPFINVDDFFN